MKEKSSIISFYVQMFNHQRIKIKNYPARILQCKKIGQEIQQLTRKYDQMNFHHYNYNGHDCFRLIHYPFKRSTIYRGVERHTMVRWKFDFWSTEYVDFRSNKSSLQQPDRDSTTSNRNCFTRSWHSWRSHDWFRKNTGFSHPCTYNSFVEQSIILNSNLGSWVPLSCTMDNERWSRYVDHLTHSRTCISNIWSAEENWSISWFFCGIDDWWKGKSLFPSFRQTISSFHFNIRAWKVNKNVSIVQTSLFVHLVDCCNISMKHGTSLVKI